MLQVFIGIGTAVLIILSILITLVVLMQRASSNSGMGAALGGGAAESALGGAAGNVLTKATIWGMGIFFGLTFLLYLGQIATHADQISEDRGATLETVIDDAEDGSAAIDQPGKNGTSDLLPGTDATRDTDDSDLLPDADLPPATVESPQQDALAPGLP